MIPNMPSSNLPFWAPQAQVCLAEHDMDIQLLRTELAILQGRAAIAIEFMDWVLNTHPELSTTFKTCRQVEVRMDT